MKKTIPFNLFGEEQELCFTIKGVGELERNLGKPIQQIVAMDYTGIDFCLSALPICLGKRNQHIYEEKIEQYLSVEGHSVNDIGIPIVHAIAVSGVLGKRIADAALAEYYPDLYPKPQEEEQGKNA